MNLGRLKFLKNTFGVPAGQIVWVDLIENGCFYYRDEFNRSCYMTEKEEGEWFEYYPPNSPYARKPQIKEQ